MPGSRTDDDAGVVNVFGLAPRVDQPRVAAAQPDHPPISLLQFGVRVGEQPPLLRHFRPYGVVAAWALFFDCLQAELVAVVDARYAWQEAEQRHRVRPVPWIADLAGHPRHVVIAEERQRDEVLHELGVAAQRPLQLMKLTVSMEDQMAHHSSYCVTESRPDFFT